MPEQLWSASASEVSGGEEGEEQREEESEEKKEEKSRWKKCKAVINGLKRFEENPGEILASTVFRFCDCCTVCIKCGKVSKKGGRQAPGEHIKDVFVCCLYFRFLY